jgi:hypothetical protein
MAQTQAAAAAGDGFATYDELRGPADATTPAIASRARTRQTRARLGCPQVRHLGAGVLRRRVLVALLALLTG